MIKKSDPSSASNPSSKSTGRKKKDVTLLRPVICICNDLYVPALRQLRQMCFLVHFHAPHTSNLTGRLMEVVDVGMMIVIIILIIIIKFYILLLTIYLSIFN